MLKKILAGAALVAFVPSAQAFLDPPFITPQQPTAGEIVSVSIRGGICDGVGSIPGYPQITRQGSTIHVVLWGVHATDPILCIIPIGTATYAVGAYSPGSYAVQVDRNYQDDLGGIVTETLGIIPFAVAGGLQQPVPLPTLNPFGAGTLGLMLFAIAQSTLRRIRRSR